MHKLDYNIEVAHIYADEEFGKEQIKGIEILKEVIAKLNEEKKTFVISVLVDEFHPVVFKIDKNKLIEDFKKNNIDIDFIGYESKLGDIGDQLIQMIPKSELKLEHFHKPEKEVIMLQEQSDKIGLKEEFDFSYRHTCALLSASWSLCRLGSYKIPQDAIDNLNNKVFEAERTITILPETYHSVENKVLEIIESTEFRDVIKRIEYRFFKM